MGSAASIPGAVIDYRDLEIIEKAINTRDPGLIRTLEGNKQAVKYLKQSLYGITNLEKIDITCPLHYAAIKGEVECLKALLAIGSNPNAVCQSSDGDTLPLLCCVFDHFRDEKLSNTADILKMLEVLISHEAKANCACMTLDGTFYPVLRIALEESKQNEHQLKVIKLLLEKGADPNVPVVDGIVLNCLQLAFAHT